MEEIPEVTSSDPNEVYASGRRHLAVKDYSNAVSTLGHACELLATKHGEQADECAEAYLWYGKALLGLSREESGVLGDRVPQGGDEEKESDEDQDENEDESESEENNEAEAVENNKAESKEEDAKTENGDLDNKTDDAKEATSTRESQPGTSHTTENGDESTADLGDEDDVDNLQLAWEMLDLSRSILEKRLARDSLDATLSLLADVHLTLGEVALESETYDKAIIDMRNCLGMQKELYSHDDRRIAETHYQIGLANSLSSNFQEAIIHFKNAANILETRIKNLESPPKTKEGAVRKHAPSDPTYSAAEEIKELKELLPEIHDKIQDMLEYKAETMRKLREQLCGANGSSSSGGPSGDTTQKQVTNISHLVKRKRKPEEDEDGAPAKNAKP